MGEVCNRCYGGSTADLTGAVQLKQIDKIINTNYSMLGVFLLLFIISIIAFYYIFTLLYKELKIFMGLSKKRIIKNDDEYYDETNDMKYDVSNYYIKEKQNFLKTMKKEYKEYNDTKSDYIRKNFSIDNDDIINEKILFDKYDDY